VEPDPDAIASEKDRRVNRVPLSIILFGIFCVAIVALMCDSKRRAWEDSRVQTLVRGRVTVTAGNYVAYRVLVSSSMLNARVAGRIAPSDRRADDIEVVVLTESGFANWIRGQEIQKYSLTHGAKAVVHFDIPLEPGAYVVAFSNRDSTVSDACFAAEISLIYGDLLPDRRNSRSHPYPGTMQSYVASR
jgi:hypothetical protein